MLSGDLTIKIPGEVKRALKIPEKELEPRLCLELAVHLYEEWLLSFGKAAELAHKSHWEFAEELARRKISRHYTEDDLETDIKFAQGVEEADGH